MGVSLAKISPVRQTNSPLVPNRSFQFEKRCQLFVRTHNETLFRRGVTSAIQIVRPLE
jgi:hypothetical protein